MRSIKSLPIIILLLFTYSFAQSGITADELMKVRRVSDPQVSPDGKQIAFVIGDVKLTDNKVISQIYVQAIEGGTPRQITDGAKSSSSPRWSPDGSKIAFTTGGQIWTMNSGGGERQQITSISTGASGPVWSPDGKQIAFVSDVYPECSTDDCNKAEDEKVEGNKVQAKASERLLFRHWVEWRDRKRTHLFIVESSGGVARDLTPGDFDSPPYAASSSVDYAFSPDSKEIAFLKNPDKIEAISTNSDLFIVSVEGGTARNITATNRGYDVSPAYTSDGKYIIYRSQATAGFEADRWRIMRFERATGSTIELTAGFDLQAEEFVISPDNKRVYLTALQRGQSPIFSVAVESARKTAGGSDVKTLINDGYNADLRITPDGKSFIFSSSSFQSPAEIFRANVDGTIKSGNFRTSVTSINSVAHGRPFTQDLKKAEEVEWKGALNRTIHGFIVKPANYDANKKYPLLVIIHGGPQSAFNDSWGYRWNPQIFANAGYIVFLPNPRGSVGYGQKFVNEISGDWGGKAYTDIMNGVAKVLDTNPNIDRNRIGAAGASYGGYMVNWILGHNTDPRFKFAALHSHAGVYNLESMSGATEELWFVDWEFKGMPWENPVNYTRWSPHRFAKNFKTPTLVTHGELDYRVPVGEGLQLFTALQRQNIESRFVYFPDEGHWILKPQNSIYWYKEVLGWFGKHLKP